MSYSPPVANGLQNAHITLLRLPGGTWGEDHLLSYNQLNAFTILLPARHEEDVYRETIQKIYDLNYPKELMQIYCLILAVFIDLAGLREFLKAHKRRWSWREAIITLYLHRRCRQYFLASL